MKERDTLTTTTKTLSPLPQDLTATRKLSAFEARQQIWIAKKIVKEALEIGGFPAEIADRVRLESNSRFSRRMGGARCTSRGQTLAGGTVRLSSHALWRRATPEKRRNTVIHELAHVLAEHERPGTHHGELWKRIMRRLGETPKRCHTVNRDGIRRKQRRRRPAAVILNPGASVHSFRVGQRATFTFKGTTILCQIVKRNRKTLEVREVGGLFRSWRVTPGLLALAS
jgi:SprT-like family protein